MRRCSASTAGVAGALHSRRAPSLHVAQKRRARSLPPAVGGCRTHRQGTPTAPRRCSIRGFARAAGRSRARAPRERDPRPPSTLPEVFTPGRGRVRAVRIEQHRHFGMQGAVWGCPCPHRSAHHLPMHLAHSLVKQYVHGRDSAVLDCMCCLEDWLYRTAIAWAVWKLAIVRLMRHGNRATEAAAGEQKISDTCQAAEARRKTAFQRVV